MKFGVQFRLPNGEISCAGAVPFEAESAEEAIRMRVECGAHFEAGLPFDEMMRRYKAYCARESRFSETTGSALSASLVGAWLALWCLTFPSSHAPGWISSVSW